MNCKLPGLLTLVVSVAGCASSAPKETAYRPFLIPANAQIVAEGAPPISAVIGQSGTLYVYDRTTQSLPGVRGAHPLGQSHQDARPRLASTSHEALWARLRAAWR